ncbi:lipopolysaccharide biosynthesis protein [Noviherbaspirillum galbum]|uniref:Lipopolysaccharide biosynthesis protein n=1 Tax=Noviherbaspirillum galbum TaxID=2709383 RepID=A0A6B3STP5_9BURK|nr:lipopolysaccharide biosynthesis protein [Noviherbaspirillum galbum]NEX62735.1 lipopolysaccharide biosynthesis protein [Noviherbaspirillum galbum]
MEQQTNLSSKGISAVFWGSFGSALRAVLQIVTQVILARILGPSEYGIFAIASIVLSFSKFFSDVGISYGLIQKKEVSEDDIRFVFTWQLILGATVAALVYLFAGPLAAFFKEPRVVPVIQVASVICFINAVSSPSANLLKREMDFRSLQAANVISYIIGYLLVGIPMAMLGYQVWALIMAFIVSELAAFIMVYNKCRHPVRILLWQKGDKHLLVYGGRVFITNILNWIISNVDRVIVGRAFQTVDVGLYSLSYNLVSNPALTLIGVIQSALFSASAKVQDDFDRLRKALLTTIGAVTLVLFPVFAGIAACSHTILEALYGQAWLPAADLLQPISLAMPLYLLLGMATPILWVSGQTQKEFNIQVPIAIGFVIACILAARVSLEAVAWVTFGMYLLRSATIVIATCRALDLRPSAVLAAMQGGLVATVFTTALIWTTDLALRQITGHVWLWLAADVLAGGAGLLLSLWLFPRLMHHHVAQLFEKVAQRMPRKAGEPVIRFLYRSQMNKHV